MTLFLGRLSGKCWMLCRLRCQKSEGQISIKDDALDIYGKKLTNLYRFSQTFEEYEIFYKVDMSLTAKPDRNLSDSCLPRSVIHEH